MSDDDEDLAPPIPPQDLAPPIPPLEPLLPSLRDRLLASGHLRAADPATDTPDPPVRVRGHRGGVKHRREAYR